MTTLNKGNVGTVKTLTWSNCTSTNVAPDTDMSIDLRCAEYCSVQLDSTDVSGTASNIDCNVWASPDGTNWDTSTRWDGYDALGDGAIQSFAVTMGVAYIRLRLDNNTGASRADVTARVWLSPKK